MSRVVLMLLLTACSADPISPPIQAPAPAQPRKVAPETFEGVIMSRTSQLVTAELDGLVEELAVEQGGRVTAGTRLALLDDAEVRKQLDAARGAEDTVAGELRRAQTARAEAGRQARQYRSLLRDGAVSRDAVSSAQSAYAIADAQVQTAQGAVKRARAARELAEQQLRKTTIVAPIDGVITLVKVNKGQMAGRGQPIARIFDPSDLWVRFAVPLDRRERISEAAIVTVTPTAAPARQLAATIRVIHRPLEPPLQFAIVEADLDDTELADRDTLVGSMVDVRMLDR